VYNGTDIVVQVAGGVQANLAAIVRDKTLSRESADLAELSSRAPLPAARWWWDAGK
jgi:hypothetical protein